jgi:hypothetical protein
MASARFELYLVARPESGPDQDGGHTAVTWRLLSSNNRDLGRAVTTFADVQSCHLMVRRLQRLIDEATTVQVRAGRVDWSWRVRLDGQDVAVSSRTYQRRIQAESACTVFLGLVPDATVTEAPRLTRC